MRALLLTVLLLSAASAQATMYLAAFEPSTGEMGLIYSSSGGNFWQTLVKGKGLAGAQNYGLCDEATPEKFLNDGLSATEVVNRVHQQCEAVGWESYRFLVITADGKIDYVIGKDGCSIPTCGGLRAENVVATGGGLQEGVLEAAVQAFQSQSASQPFVCRLFHTLEQIYYSGGEIKEFKGASITVDHPGKANLLHVRSEIFNGGAQQNLLKNLETDLETQGVVCE